MGQLPSPPLLPTPPPKAGSRTTRSVTGGSTSIHPCLPPVLTGLPLWAGSHPLLLWVGLWAGFWGTELKVGGWPLMRSLVDRTRALGSLKQTWAVSEFLPESEGGRHNHSLSIWVLMCLTVFLCFWVSHLSLSSYLLPPSPLPLSLPLITHSSTRPPSLSISLFLPSLPPTLSPLPFFLSVSLTISAHLCGLSGRQGRARNPTPDYRVVVRVGEPS